MQKFTPTILFDKTRLPEIYKLRVFAWENSEVSSITSKNYPNGMFDNLDQTATHWIVQNEEGNIIAAARLNILNSFEETPYPGIFKRYLNLFPSEIPFAYYSRLVVHPDYRKQKIGTRLDIARLNWLKENKIDWAITTARLWRIDVFKTYGYKEIGAINPEDDANYHFKFEFAQHLLLLMVNDAKIPKIDLE